MTLLSLVGVEFFESASEYDFYTVASQNDWGPLDVLILGALHHEPCHINVGLNARPKGLRAVSVSYTHLTLPTIYSV